MSIRKAEKAGSWYAGAPDELRQEIAYSLEQAETYLAKLPAGGKSGEKPVAAMIPHAGLVYSGGIAATAFKIIRDALPRVDAFVIFAACHREHLRQPAVWAEGAWDTPLGPVSIDAELAAMLIGEGLGVEREDVHHGDNAVELLVPFIKALFPEAAIVPVAMGMIADSWNIGRKAAEAAAKSKELSKRCLVALASSDLTHYGAAFGVTPAGFGKPALEWTRANDRRFLEAVTAMRGNEIVSIALKDRSACGAGAAAAAAGWAHSLGAESGRLLAYATSYDVMPDNSEAEHFVGYGSVVFEIPR